MRTDPRVLFGQLERFPSFFQRGLTLAQSSQGSAIDDVHQRVSGIIFERLLSVRERFLKEPSRRLRLSGIPVCVR